MHPTKTKPDVMRYAVIGTGAVGGYYGCKLAKAGKDVHFLLHSDYDYVCSNGFFVESCDGSFVENTLRMTPYSPSMKLDFDNHRPMEINYLYTRAIAEAHSVGYDMPCLETLEAELRFIEEHR